MLSKGVTSVLWLALALLSLACTVQAQTNSQITGCTEGSEYIISLNETLTPPSDVSSSTRLTFPFFAPARNALHFGHDEGGNLITWCTVRTDPNPSVAILFSEPVVITGFIASGSTYQPASTAYITNFTIEYTQRNENGDVSIVYYRTENDNSIKYFTQNKLVKLFNLERPIATETGILIRPIEWFDSGRNNPGRTADIVCIGVGLIGCRASDASFEQVPATTEEVMTETMEFTVSDTGPVTEGTTDVGGVATGQQIIVKDYQVLEIVLPIALLTILVVLVAVVLGVLLCVSRGRKKIIVYEIPQAPPINTVTTPTSPDTKILDNSALYFAPSEIGRRDTIRKVTNDLYGEDSGTNTQIVAHDNLEVIYSDTQYTEVPMSELSRIDRRESVEDKNTYQEVASASERRDDPDRSFSIQSNSAYRNQNTQL